MKYFSLCIRSLLLLLALSSLVISCKKSPPLVDGTYPDQKIYMSQAAVTRVGPNANGIYTITPNVEGVAHRFSVDVAAGKVYIPLGLIKSGISASGSYTVNIASNTDTVAKVIALNAATVNKFLPVTATQLPASAFTLPATATIQNDSIYGSFNLVVNLPYLLSNLTQKFVVAVGISGSGKAAVNPALATTVILVDPEQIITPVATFSTYIYPVTKTVNINNTSANAVSYSWNFGDTSPLSSEVAPSHIYTASGTYTVTLTTTGIAGSGAPVVKTATITIP